MKKLGIGMGLLFALVVGAVAPSPSRAAVSSTTAIWNEGVLNDGIDHTADGQDAALCAASHSHDTAVAAPGEGTDRSGWCDDISYRTKTFTVPATVGGAAVRTATLDASVAFASGDAPPTTALPVRKTADVQLMVTEGLFQTGSTLGALPNVPFVPSHAMQLALVPGHTYTITVDPFAGFNVEWHVEAALTLVG
jgi:hypothetical protein